MRDPDDLLAALARSPFRSRFRLGPEDRRYLKRRGLALILRHATDFIAQRLAPARPKNDGRQTPWRGHPVFIAQHATATCCRSCLAKWHGLPAGRELTTQEQQYVLSVLENWFRRQSHAVEDSNPEANGRLF
jgi:hypothetical protein